MIYKTYIGRDMPTERLHPATVSALGFTGTRRGMTAPQMFALASLLPLDPFTFHHGNAIGADDQAHRIVNLFAPNATIHIWPSTLKRTQAERPAYTGEVLVWHPPENPLVRNVSIIHASKLLVAFPHTTEEILRSGTWHAIRYAKKTCHPLVIVFPDGSAKVYSGVRAGYVR